MKLVRIGIAVMAVMLAAVGVSLAAGTGDGDAFWADGAPQTVAPHGATWFRFLYGGDNNDVTVTLDTGDASNLRLSIYTPEQVAAWQNGEKLKSVGDGSQDPNHALVWSGRFPAGGMIYAVAYNDGDAPATVNVKATGDNTQTTDEKAPTPTPLPNPFKETTPIGKGISGKLAFIDAQGGNLFTVNGDGTNLQRVSFGMDPQWNHAGTQIALARQGPIPGVLTINADGSNEHILYGTNDPRSPDWSPDDSQVVFTRMTGQRGGGSVCFGARCFEFPTQAQWKLGLLDTSDGTYSDIPTTTHAFTPTWNADGTTIAYNDTTLGVVKTSTQDDVTLEPFIGDLRPGVGSYDPLKVLSPQYSPDGKRIVMMVGQPPVWQVAIANADGSDRHLLTTQNFLDFVHPNNVAPVWSPDGSKILFLSDRNGKWEIFSMNPDGTGVEQVLKNVTDQIPLNYSFQGERMLSWSR